MNWFSNFVGQRNFNRSWRQVSEEKYRAGIIDSSEYARCIEAYHNPEVLKRARNHLKAAPGMLGGISDWNWKGILQWFRDYFIPAMKIILPIMLLLLQENPTTKNQPPR